MKKLNLFIALLIGITSISCSSDDDNIIENPPQSEKQLKRIESTEYYNGHVIKNIKRYFDDGKILVDSTWRNNGYFNSKRKYTYNSKGLISNETLEDFQTGFTAEVNYNYDEQGRLINYDYLENNPDYGVSERNINYNYISETTVKAINMNNDNTSILEFNSDGFLLSKSNNQSIYAEYEYHNNGDIEMISYPNQQKHLTVNYSQEVLKGGYSRLENFFNGNKKNFYIIAGTIPYAGESYLGAKKLISSRVYEENGNTSSINYQHTLDDEGYLIQELQNVVDYYDNYYSTEYFYE